MTKRHIADVIKKWVYPPDTATRVGGLEEYLTTDPHPTYRMAGYNEFTDETGVEHYLIVWEVNE